MKTPAPYIEAALQSIAAIHSYRSATEAEFLSDAKTQDAILMRLQDIGENLSRVRDGFPEFWEVSAERGWNEAVSLRHIISHAYGEVRLDLIWAVVEKDLGELERSLRRSLQA